MYDINAVRSQFPILSREVYGRPLVYLDNAATTQKPLCVLDAMREEYLNVNANVHRGVHYLSQQATDLHEAARETVRRFINARTTEEIVFTRGTTEAINLVASSFCQWLLTSRPTPHTSHHTTPPEILVTDMEHHSNIVPWQLQAQRHGIIVRHLPISDDGRLPEGDELEHYFTEHTRLLSLTHVSNVLGTVNPVADIIKKAHEHGVPVLLDAAQSAPHIRLDVQQLDCDFMAFSGHKMYGPTGVGVLYGKYDVLDSMPPWHGGGEMIKNVTFEKTTYADVPARFEAGTPMIAEVIGFGKAIEWINEVGIENIRKHEEEITNYALEQLAQIPQVKIFGNPKERGALISVTLDGIAVSDAAMILDEENVAVRSGHHCAQPVMDRFGVDATLRLSFGAYTLKRDIDRFVAGIKRVLRLFG